MKNFPHQFSDLTKLTSALGVANVLIASGDNFSDDGVFGEALVNADVYAFRSLIGSVADRLAAEKKKSPDSQGFRTAAREIRRFFLISDLIAQGDGGFTITPRGADILNAVNNVVLRNALWRDAMLQLRLKDASNNVSHPYRILLKLVADNPGIETSKLLLALEARDDSPEEYGRISVLAQLNMPKILKAIGVSESNARNAVKILPALAEQVGDIRRSQQGLSFPQSKTIATEDTLEEDQAIYPSELTPVDPANISALPDFAPPAGGMVDLSAAIEIRQKRTIAHHNTVISIAGLLANNGYTLYENPFDCLGYKATRGGILIEVKTLDGSLPDERRQTEKALGQLKAYSYFNVPYNFKLPEFAEVAAFSEAPDVRTIGFMKENQVYPTWREDDYWLTADSGGNIVALSPDELFSDSSS